MVGSMALGGEFARHIVVALVTLALSAVLVSLFGITGPTSPLSVSESAAVVRALATPAFLAAGALRLARWRVTGESHCGLRGVALLVLGGVSVPSVALARSLSASGEGVAVFTCVRALSVGAILFVMTVALADDAPHWVDLRRRATVLATTMAAATGLLLLAGRDRLLPGTSPQAVVIQSVATALALAWLILAAWVVVKGGHAEWARPTAPLLAAMGLAEACRLPDRPVTTLVAAGLTAAVAFVAAASALVDLVRAAHDEHAATEDLTRELTNARTAVSARDAWRADLAHDARGTLAGIRAALHTLDRHADGIDQATASRLRLATLAELAHLEQMLDQSDADDGVFDVADVVRTVTDVRRAAGLRVDVILRPARVRGVAGDLASVLQNLLVNVQAHAPGAGVTVDVRTQGGLARIVVADDGPGMPPTFAGSAFGRGARGPRSNGSGLGLSIARTLTRRHGGELDLLPSTGGSTFVISWPLVEHVGTTPLQWEVVAS
jgi:signal transduction histidine kinase